MKNTKSKQSCYLILACCLYLAVRPAFAEINVHSQAYFTVSCNFVEDGCDPFNTGQNQIPNTSDLPAVTSQSNRNNQKPPQSEKASGFLSRKIGMPAQLKLIANKRAAHFTPPLCGHISRFFRENPHPSCYVSSDIPLLDTAHCLDQWKDAFSDTLASIPIDKLPTFKAGTATSKSKNDLDCNFLKFPVLYGKWLDDTKLSTTEYHLLRQRLMAQYTDYLQDNLNIASVKTPKNCKRLLGKTIQFSLTEKTRDKQLTYAHAAFSRCLRRHYGPVEQYLSYSPNAPTVTENLSNTGAESIPYSQSPRASTNATSASSRSEYKTYLDSAPTNEQLQKVIIIHQRGSIE